MSHYLEKELFDKLQSNPDLFNLIRDHALDGLWYWDLEKPENEWMDNRFWETLGYNPEDIPSKAIAWHDKINPEDKDRAFKVFEEHIKDPSRPFDVVGRYYHKKGHWVWIRCRGFAIRDSQGKPIRAIGTNTEITALKRSEQLLERASQAARIGFWELDFINQDVFWSKVTREIHEVEDGFIPNFEIGVNFYEEGESRDRISEVVDRAIENGEPFDEELRIISATNRPKWIRAIGIPELDRDGSCRRLYGLFQDIDIQVSSRQAIRSERELYRQVIEGAQLGAWELNFDNEEILVNRRLAEIIDYDLEELLRLGYSQWFDLIHANDRPTFNQKLEACLKGEALELNLELRLKRRKGQYIWAAVNAKVFSPTGFFKTKRLVGTVHDISSLKAKGEVLKTFISNNPMAMAMFDTKMRYIACSDKWYLDYNIQDTNIIGKSHYEVFPNLSQEWKTFHRKCLQGEIFKAEEDSFKPAPGLEVWVRWEIRPWYEDNNKVGGMIMFTENITDRKLTEKQLLLSEATFRGNFENAAIGMAVIARDGSWIEVNEKVCEITGYTKEELSQLSFQDITHPDDLDLDLELVQELLDGKRRHYQLEKRYIRKNGEIAYVLLGASIIRDDQGNFVHFVSQIVDISKRKKAEFKSKELLDATIDQNDRLNSFAHIVSHNLRTHSSGISKLLELLKEDPRSMEVIDLALQASLRLNETIEDLNKVVEIQGKTSSSFVSISLEAAIQEVKSTLQFDIQSFAEIKTQLNHQVALKGLQVYLDSIIFNLISNAVKYRHPDRKAQIEISDALDGKWYAIKVKDNGLGIDLDRHRERLFGMYNTFHENDNARGLGLYLMKHQIDIMNGKVEVESELGVGSTFIVYLPYEEN